ncbi:MAG: helix-turn-helix transcriptional regulator [Vicinamibacterales bacterium]
MSLFDAEHQWPQAWRLAAQLDSDPNVPDLDGLAYAFGQSRSTLTRQFRAEFGMSIRDYQAVARLRVAWNLLRETRLSVEEVADRAGYASPTNLYAAFRKFTTLRPGSVRLATDAFDSYLAPHVPAFPRLRGRAVPTNPVSQRRQRDARDPSFTATSHEHVVGRDGGFGRQASDGCHAR